MHKYSAALLSIAIVVLTAFIASPTLTPTSIIQLAILAVGAIVTYLLPLVPGAWAGALKTGAAVVVAVLAAVLPFVVTGGITVAEATVVILAALNALAVEVGVQLRRTAPVPVVTNVYTPAPVG